MWKDIIRNTNVIVMMWPKIMSIHVRVTNIYIVIDCNRLRQIETEKPNMIVNHNKGSRSNDSNTAS